MSSLSSVHRLEVPSSRHSVECLCELCERTGAGYFAQRAALAGDATAAQHLSAPIFAELSAQKTCHRHARRGRQ